MNVARIRTHIRRRFIVILLWGTALTNCVDRLLRHEGAAQASTPPSGATKRRRYALYDAGASPISDRLPGPWLRARDLPSVPSGGPGSARSGRVLYPRPRPPPGRHRRIDSAPPARKMTRATCPAARRARPIEGSRVSERVTSLRTDAGPLAVRDLAPGTREQLGELL